MMDHVESSFVTLTYNETFLPSGSNLFPNDLVLFFKKLRGYYYEEDIEKADRCERPVFRDIRFYLTGEYGTKLGRPHYHIALFGVGQSEKDREKVRKAWSFSVGKQNYSLGFCYFGELNKHSAGYIAKYIMKGANKNDYKKTTDRKFKKRVENHLQGRLPEFQRMSRGRAIGSSTVERFAKKSIGREFSRYKIGKRINFLGKTLKAKASKVTGLGVSSDSYYAFINDVFSKVREDETIEESINRRFEGARNKQRVRSRMFKPKEIL